MFTRRTWKDIQKHHLHPHHRHTGRDTYTHRYRYTHTQRPTHCLNTLDLTLQTEHLTHNANSDFTRDEKCFRATRRLVVSRGRKFPCQCSKARKVMGPEMKRQHPHLVDSPRARPHLHSQAPDKGGLGLNQIKGCPLKKSMNSGNTER